MKDFENKKLLVSLHGGNPTLIDNNNYDDFMNKKQLKAVSEQLL